MVAEGLEPSHRVLCWTRRCTIPRDVDISQNPAVGATTTDRLSFGLSLNRV